MSSDSGAAAAATAAASASNDTTPTTHPSLLHIQSIARILKFAAVNVDHAMALAETCSAWHDAARRWNVSWWHALINAQLEEKKQAESSALRHASAQWKYCPKRRSWGWVAAEPLTESELLYSILYSACKHGHYPVIEVLVAEYEIDLNAILPRHVYWAMGKVPYGWSPLHVACHELQARAIASLVMCGASYNADAARQNAFPGTGTPLHVLCARADSSYKTEAMSALLFAVFEFRSFVRDLQREAVAEAQQQKQQPASCEENAAAAAAASAAAAGPTTSTTATMTAAGKVIGGRGDNAEDDDEDEELQQLRSTIDSQTLSHT
jgi:hypothetical protein